MPACPPNGPMDGPGVWPASRSTLVPGPGPPGGACPQAPADAGHQRGHRDGAGVLRPVRGPRWRHSPTGGASAQASPLGQSGSGCWGGRGSDAIVASAWIALGIVFLLPNFPDNVGWFPSIIRFLLLAFVVFFVCWFLVEPKVLIGTFPLMGGVQEMKHLAPMPQWYRWVAPTCL